MSRGATGVVRSIHKVNSLSGGVKPTAAMLSGHMRVAPNGVCIGAVAVGLGSHAASTRGKWKPVVTLVGDPIIVGSTVGPGKLGETVRGGVFSEKVHMQTTCSYHSQTPSFGKVRRGGC